MFGWIIGGFGFVYFFQVGFCEQDGFIIGWVGDNFVVWIDDGVLVGMFECVE